MINVIFSHIPYVGRVLSCKLSNGSIPKGVGSKVHHRLKGPSHRLLVKVKAFMEYLAIAGQSSKRD